jgi:hypothetical protein
MLSISLIMASSAIYIWIFIPEENNSISENIRLIPYKIKKEENSKQFINPIKD